MLHFFLFFWNMFKICFAMIWMRLKKNMRKSKHMIKMINIWAYNGQVPANVSAPRWNAICKFIQKNFDDLRIAP